MISLLTKINWALGSLLLVVAVAGYFLGWGHSFNSERKTAEELMSQLVEAQRRHYQENNRYVYFSSDANSMIEGFQALRLDPNLTRTTGFIYDSGVGENNDELVMRAIASAKSVREGELAPLIYSVKVNESGSESSRWL